MTTPLNRKQRRDSLRNFPVRDVRLQTFGKQRRLHNFHRAAPRQTAKWLKQIAAAQASKNWWQKLKATFAKMRQLGRS